MQLKEKAKNLLKIARNNKFIKEHDLTIDKIEDMIYF